jgi:hypothetical protein
MSRPSRVRVSWWHSSVPQDEHFVPGSMARPHLEQAMVADQASFLCTSDFYISVT